MPRLPFPRPRAAKVFPYSRLVLGFLLVVTAGFLATTGGDSEADSGDLALTRSLVRANDRATDNSGTDAERVARAGVRTAAATGTSSVFAHLEIPDVKADHDSNSVELGLRFVPKQDGTITAIRFYKSRQNAGPHVGTLWDNDGTALARVDFGSGPAEGWRTATLATPVAVESGHEYVASYLAPTGRYASQEGAFTVSRETEHLLLPAGAGVYAYGSGSFPTENYRNSNYFVDVVFSSSPAGENPEPTPGTPSTAPTTAPTSGGEDPSEDADGELFAAGDVPAVEVDPDRKAVELGLRFIPKVAGTVTAIRFYRSAENSGPHTGTLWDPSGKALATVEFDDDTRDGWQSATLDTPVKVRAARQYVVSYRAPSGLYSADERYFELGLETEFLTIPAGAGVYTYAKGALPTQNYRNSNYYIDLSFTPDGTTTPVPTTAPTTDTPTTDEPTTDAPTTDAPTTDTPTTDSPTTDAPTTDTPTTEPTSEPTTEPTSEPTTQPTTTATTEPTSEPTTQPTTDPTTQPTTAATTKPTTQPTSEPTTTPTATKPTSTPQEPSAGSVLNLPTEPWWGGPSYYAKFPKAAVAGWTSPSFFPISVFFGKPSHTPALKSVGINTFMGAEHDGSPISMVTKEGISVLAQLEWTNTEIGTDSRVVGWHASDECDMALGECGPGENENLAMQKKYVAQIRAKNDGRMAQANFGNGVLGTWWSPNTMDDQVDLMDLVSVDKYAYSSPHVQGLLPSSPYWPKGKAAASAGAYGWQQDRMESYMTPAGTKPNWVFVEAAMPYLTEAGARSITVEQIGGAVWNSIIHGAAGIAYFQHNNNGVCGNYALVECSTALKNGVRTLNAEVTSLAPIINTPTYKWNFGTGLDTALKAYDGYAYVFAMTDGGSGSRTFTLPAGTTGSVEVVGENRTLSTTGGTFTDSFAAEYSHHVYRVALK